MRQTAVINDLKQDVLDALQGRSDISDDQVARYMVRAARELSESYPFPELQVFGPLFVLTPNVSDYDISNFVRTNDIDSEYSMPESFSIYVDYPNNTTKAPLRYKTPAAIEGLTSPSVVGVPAWFTRFGTQFRLGPVPMAPFTTQLLYQVKHPFSASPDVGDPLYIPQSWFDILAYATAERLALIKRWTDQQQVLHDILYGDPAYQASGGLQGRPGLIAARTFQQERDEKYNSRNVSIVVHRVNPR